jgi:hypothetical protein
MRKSGGWRPVSSKLGIAAAGVLLVVGVIVGSASCGGTPAAAATPVAATATPTVEPSSTPSPTPTPTPDPTPTPTPVPAPPPPTPAPPPPPPTQAPVAVSCYPLSNSGTCYRPGEFCRSSDHGATGLTADGRAIVCVDRNGWRWVAA